MTGQVLKKARREQKLTQKQVAAQLGVSQPYVALLERGERPLTPTLARKAVRLLKVPATVIPCDPDFRNQRTTTDSLARQLSALGYPGFQHLRAGWVKNPAEVLLEALQQADLDARVAEALPWVLRHHPHLDQGWLVRQARLHNLTNRLGFVVSLAMHVEERRGDVASTTYQDLALLERALRESRLEAEFTFGLSGMSPAQQEWVRQNRSKEAEEWHVLTTWQPEHLQHV